MAKYIDIEKAIEAIEEVWNRKYAKCGYQPLRDCYRMLMKRLKSAPEVDIAEVINSSYATIRCQDCKYYETDEFGKELEECEHCFRCYGYTDNFKAKTEGE